jgi:hypothetical protein
VGDRRQSRSNSGTLHNASQRIRLAAVGVQVSRCSPNSNGAVLCQRNKIAA